MFKKYEHIIFIISLFIGAIFIYNMSGIDFNTIKLYNNYHSQKCRNIINNKKLKQKIILDKQVIDDEMLVNDEINKSDEEYSNKLYQEIENDKLKINTLKDNLTNKLYQKLIHINLQY